jgi:peptidoglycan hydrolase FlgJ
MTTIAATSAMTPPTEQATKDPNAARLQKAAQQFEAIFIRQMLTTLEKTARISGSSQGTGASMYGSMVVNVMADAIAAAGGVGLGSALARDFNTGQPNGSPPASSEVKR